MIHGGGVTTSSPGSEHGVVRVIQYDDRDHDASIAHSARRTTDEYYHEVAFSKMRVLAAEAGGLDFHFTHRFCSKVVRRSQYSTVTSKVQEA